SLLLRRAQAPTRTPEAATLDPAPNFGAKAAAVLTRTRDPSDFVHASEGGVRLWPALHLRRRTRVLARCERVPRRTRCRNCRGSDGRRRVRPGRRPDAAPGEL